MVDEINKEIDLITAAHMAAQEVRIEREKLAEVLKKVEAYEARTILAGKSNAGQPMQHEPTATERVNAENKIMFKNTILDGVLK